MTKATEILKSFAASNGASVEVSARNSYLGIPDGSLLVSVTVYRTTDKAWRDAFYAAKELRTAMRAAEDAADIRWTRKIRQNWVYFGHGLSQRCDGARASFVYYPPGVAAPAESAA
jgi:metal-dependent amidase/aminoacylase/carboxypeptidase family protein